jgi:hypothetical protein
MPIWSLLGVSPGCSNITSGVPRDDKDVEKALASDRARVVALEAPDRGMSLEVASRDLTADQLSWSAFMKSVDEVVTAAIGAG